MVRQHLLAAELRKLRQAARLTHTDVASRLGWPQAKVSKIEGARQHVGIDAVIALADICHAGTEHRDQLVELARSARERGWWESYRDVLAADRRQQVGFESEAAVVRAFAVDVVPDLLQTEDYAAAVLEARRPGASTAELDRWREVLRRRRARLDDGGLALDLALGESALHREVGGPAVLADQLRWLRELAARPGITLRVLPFSAGALATDESFELLSFSLGLPDVVVRPAGAGVEMIEERGTVAAYSELLERMRASALPPEESARRIAAGRRVPSTT
ncbi:helix-turn-helix domain-containing protein [Saccharopolyspora sp. MS10]|uniref:helix-turn-helix domain-containing protein n=1 Tax=Saccharopolyspora sp. MS10 TaxID=3385973 RepID=UPI0039A25E04